MTYGDGLADRIRAIAPQGVDAALDASGRGSLPALVDLTGDPGRVITLADPSAEALGVRFAFGEPDDMPAILADAVTLVAAGTITLPIARTYALSDVALAGSGDSTGAVSGERRERAVAATPTAERSRRCSGHVCQPRAPAGAAAPARLPFTHASTERTVAARRSTISSSSPSVATNAGASSV